MCASRMKIRPGTASNVQSYAIIFYTFRHLSRASKIIQIFFSRIMALAADVLGNFAQVFHDNPWFYLNFFIMLYVGRYFARYSCESTTWIKKLQ